MASIKDIWNKATSWVIGTANTVVSANISPVIDPVVNTVTTAVTSIEESLKKTKPEDSQIEFNKTDGTLVEKPKKAKKSKKKA